MVSQVIVQDCLLALVDHRHEFPDLVKHR